MGFASFNHDASSGNRACRRRGQWRRRLEEGGIRVAAGEGFLGLGFRTGDVGVVYPVPYKS